METLADANDVLALLIAIAGALIVFRIFPYVKAIQEDQRPIIVELFGIIGCLSLFVALMNCAYLWHVILLSEWMVLGDQKHYMNIILGCLFLSGALLSVMRFITHKNKTETQ